MASRDMRLRLLGPVMTSTAVRPLRLTRAPGLVSRRVLSDLRSARLCEVARATAAIVRAYPRRHRRGGECDRWVDRVAPRRLARQCTVHICGRSRTGTAVEIELESIAVVPEPAVVRTMLLGGAAIGWLPDFHAADDVANGSLIRLLPEWRTGSVEAHAIYPNHRSLSAKVRVFIDALIEQLSRRIDRTAREK